jgi:23S rRNA maturation-related 3'-5' exoribonuclease YhaM
MSADFFLTDGARVVPDLFAVYEDARQAHHAYWMALDLANVTPTQELEAIRLRDLASDAEKKARAAFSDALST